MASAAIPVAFRPVHVDAPPKQRGWYIDGGSQAQRADQAGAGPRRRPRRRGRDHPRPGRTARRAGLARRARRLRRRHRASCTPSSSTGWRDDIRALRRVNTLVSAGREADAPSGYRAIPNLYLGPPKPGLISQTANDVFSRPLRRDPPAALRPRHARSAPRRHAREPRRAAQLRVLRPRVPPGAHRPRPQTRLACPRPHRFAVPLGAALNVA